jgi:hypothetical protein
MKVHSAKAKGRRHQQYVCKKLVETGYDLETDDIRSASMGAPGEDILFSPAARRQFPFSIECKNVEKLSIWSAINQCRENAPEDTTPAVVFTRNHETAQISLPFEKFLEIYKVYLRMKDLYEDMYVKED